jgi:multidrug resistance efflux pump
MQLVPVAPVEPNQSPNLPSETRLPTSRRRVILLSVLSLTAGIAATLWYEQVRYERFTGFLQARLRTVAAARDAQVAEFLVSPGTVVMAGQPLVRLKDTAFEQRLEAKQRDVESLEIELSRSQASLEVELELRRKDILASILDARLRSGQASRKGLIPTGMTGQKKSGWGTAENSDDRHSIQQTGGDQPAAKPSDEPSKLPLTDVELLAQHIDELERINRELPEKISRSMGVDLAKARLAHARAELARLESQQKELTLIAETSGMVGVFNKEVGDHVSAHEPIVQLLDEEQPYLLLQIPSSRISDFAPGTLVDLHFPGGKQGQGRVEEIPPQTSPIPVPGATGSDTVITAHIEPVGQLWPNLPFGSEVEVRRQR